MKKAKRPIQQIAMNFGGGELPGKANKKAKIANYGSKALDQLQRISKSEWVNKFSQLLVNLDEWNSKLCGLNWKMKSSKNNRVYIQLQVAHLKNTQSDIILLPTPCTVETDNREKVLDNMRQGLSLKSRKAGHNIQNNLTNMATIGLLPTPMVQYGSTAKEGEIEGKNKVKNGKRVQGLHLHDMAVHGLIPTPNASDANTANNKNNHDVDRGYLRGYATMGLLPTPAAVDYKQTTLCESQRERSTLPGLMVKAFLPTPAEIENQDSKLTQEASDWKGMLLTLYASDGLRSGMTMESLRNHNKPNAEKSNLAEQIAHKVGGGTSQLNPLFVTEMMGFPSDWLIHPFLQQQQS